MALNIYDKTLYLQRIFYALSNSDKGRSREEMEVNGDEWHYTANLREAEMSIDDAINCLHIALEHRGLVPKIEEI